MNQKEQILALAKKKARVYTSDLIKKFSVSRQYLNQLITELIKEGRLIKIGKTRGAFYVLPKKIHEQKNIYFRKTFLNKSLEEDVVLRQAKERLPFLNNLPENISRIFDYTFSEMLNNAIEHSDSKHINVEIVLTNDTLYYSIRDVGIGVFRNILKKMKLNSELEAIQDLLKGKTTTMPDSHSGEGIFFSSKMADIFILKSFEYELIISNKLNDFFIEKNKYPKKGTHVTFKIDLHSKKKVSEIFEQYTHVTGDGIPGFDKTKIQVKLYTLSDSHISRSQARRILAGLEKFKVIEFDFQKVSTVGQAFADEIFRVFHSKYPHIQLQVLNMNEVVDFMVSRSRKEKN